jgi:hypothetical protein
MLDLSFKNKIFIRIAFVLFTYVDAIELTSIDCGISELARITGVAVVPAKRCFCLSCTDKRGFDLMKYFVK